MAAENINVNSAQQFDDTPVASKQGSSVNVDPIKVPKQTSSQSQPSVVSVPNPRPQQVPQAMNVYEYEQSQEAMRNRRGSDTQGGVAGGLVTNHYGEKYFTDKIWGIDIGVNNTDTTNPYWSGRNPLSEATDYEHLRRNSQSVGVAGVNILNQFVGKTVVNTVGGIIGGFYSLGSALVNWEGSKLYDNSVNRTLDSATEWIDENNNVNTSERARESQSPLNIFNVEGAKGLGDGFSFVAGAVLSEVIMAWATGGLGNAASMAAKSAGTGGQIVNRLSKLPGALNKVPAKAIANLGSKMPAGNALNSYGQAIKRAMTLSDEIGDVARGINSAEDLAKLEKLIPNGLTNGMDDLAKLAKINKATSSVVGGGRKLVTGTFWEAGLEARQADDEFFQTNMEKARREIDEMNIDQSQKDSLLKKKELELKDMAKSVGLWTFGLNAGVLTVSNRIQFPTVFGTPSRINPTSLKGQFKKTLQEVGKDYKYALKSGAKGMTRVGQVARILKNPLSEGLEEMLQSGISSGTTSYYDDVLKARTDMGLLYGDIAESWSENEPSIIGTIGSTLHETFTDREAYKEGVIGAVMGLVGIPMFKRNANGKLRPYMTGGIWQDISDIKKTNKLLNDGTTVLDSQADSITKIIGFNKQRSVIDKKAATKKDLAVLANDMQAIEDAQFDDVHKIAYDMNSKGMRSYLMEEMDDIDKLSFEEYKKKFSYDDSFTKEEWVKDKARTKEMFERSNKAYDSVYKTFGIDALNDDDTSNNMINILSHAMAYDDYAKHKIQALKDKILQSDVFKTITDEKLDFDKLVKTTAEYQREYAMYQSSLNSILKGDAEQSKIEMEELMVQKNDAATGIPKNIMNHLNDLAEANELNDTESIEAIEKVIQDEINSNPDATTRDAIFESIQKFKTAQEALNKKTKKFNSIEELEKAAFSTDGLAQLQAKKSLKQAEKDINKKLRKEYREAKKGLLEARKKNAPQISSSKLIEIVQANNKLKELIANSSLDNKAMSFLERMDPNSGLLDMEDSIKRLVVLHQKQATALSLLNDVHNLGAGKSYIQFKLKEFDQGMMSLKMQMLMIDESSVNDDDYVVNVTGLKEIYDVQIKRKEELIKNDYVKQEAFEEVDKILESAKRIIDSFSEQLAVQDQVEKEGDEIDKTLDDKIVKEEIEDNSGNKQEGFKLIKTEIASTKGLTRSEIPSAKKELDGVNTDTQTRPTTLLNKSTMFTLNPGKNSQMKDVRPDEDGNNNSLRDLIDDGTIKYNSSAVVKVEDQDPVIAEDPDFIKDVLNNDKTLVEKYKRGFDEVHKDPSILDLDYNQLSEDVKFYISKARVTMSFYDKQIRVKEKKQHVNIGENDSPSIVIYTPSPTLNHTKDERDQIHFKYNQEVIELKAKYEADKLELIKEGKYSTVLDDTGKVLSSIPSSPEAHKLENSYQIQLNNIEMKRDRQVHENNDLANFAMRLTAIKQSIIGEKNEGVKMRVGNFINGSFEDASDNTEEFSLTEGDNPLFGPQFNDEFSFDKLGFSNSKGTLVDFKTGKTIPLREGSVVESHNLSTGKIYTYITTPNGQRLTIKLNTPKLVDRPEIFEEIIHQIKELSKLEGENKGTAKITLSKEGAKIMSYANGMTYQEFFNSLLRAWKGTASSTSDLGGFFNITPKGVIRIGSKVIDNTEITEELEKSIRIILSNARMFVHKATLYKEGNLNSAYGDFLLDNKLINHNMETSKNNRRFLPEQETLKMQLHVLNDTSDALLTPKAKVKSDFGDKVDTILKGLLGLRRKENEKGTLKNINNSLIFDQISKQLAARYTEKLNSVGENYEGDIFDEVLKEYFKEKQDAVKQLYVTYPDLLTPRLYDLSNANDFKEFSFNEKDVASGNVLENYTYSLITLLNHYNKNKSETNKQLAGYSENIKIVDKFKRLMLDDEFNAINTGTPVIKEGISKEGKSYNYLGVAPVSNEKAMSSVALEFKKAKEEYDRIKDHPGTTLEAKEKAKERYEKALEEKKLHLKKAISVFLKVGRLVELTYNTGNSSKSNNGKDDITFGKSKYFINYVLNNIWTDKKTGTSKINSKTKHTLPNTPKTDEDVHLTTLVTNANRKPFYLKYKDPGVKTWTDTTDLSLIDSMIDEETGELTGGLLMMTVTDNNGITKDVVVMGSNEINGGTYSSFDVATGIQLYGLDSKMNIIPEKVEELDRLLGIFVGNKNSLSNTINKLDKALGQKFKSDIVTEEGIGLVEQSDSETGDSKKDAVDNTEVKGILKRTQMTKEKGKTVTTEPVKSKSGILNKSTVPKFKAGKDVDLNDVDFGDDIDSDVEDFTEESETFEDDSIESFEDNDIPDDITDVEENFDFDEVDDSDEANIVEESNNDVTNTDMDRVNKDLSFELGMIDRDKPKIRKTLKIMEDNIEFFTSKDDVISFINNALSMVSAESKDDLINSVVDMAINNEIIDNLTEEERQQCKM